MSTLWEQLSNLRITNKSAAGGVVEVCDEVEPKEINAVSDCRIVLEHTTKFTLLKKGTLSSSSSSSYASSSSSIAVVTSSFSSSSVQQQQQQSKQNLNDSDALIESRVKKFKKF